MKQRYKNLARKGYERGKQIRENESLKERAFRERDSRKRMLEMVDSRILEKNDPRRGMREKTNKTE